MEVDILVAIGGFFIAGITAIALFYQIQKQTKIESGKFSIEFLVRTGEKYKDTISHIRARAVQKNFEPYDPKEIRLLLNHFEYIAVFEQDGLIKLDHIREMFGQVLLRIDRDDKIKQIMDDTRKNNKTIYSNLISLLSKIRQMY